MLTRRTLMAAAAGALAMPAWAKTDDTPLPPPLSELDKFPFTLPDGQATTLGQERGPMRAVVVSLWATWCAPCQEEMRMLSDLRKRIAPMELDIIGINVDRQRDEKKIAAFIKRGRVNYTQLRGDPEPTYKAFGGSMPITLPRLYVFDRAGKPTRVFGRYDGQKTLKEIDAAIAAAIKA